MNDEWPNCKAYQETVAKSTSDITSIENDLNSALKALETGFELKLAQLQRLYINELEAKIKAIRITQQQVEQHGGFWEKQDHDGVQQHSPHVPMNSLALQRMSVGDHNHLPDEVIMHSLNNKEPDNDKKWIYVGNTDQEIKTYSAHLEAKIEAIRVAQRHVELNAGAEAKQTQMLVNPTIHKYLKAYHMMSVKAGDNEKKMKIASDRMMHLCGEATEKILMNLGKTDQKIKLDIAKLGIHVKNRYGYDDIKLRMDKIPDEIRQMPTTLDTGEQSSLEQFFGDSKQAVLERFRVPVDEIVERLTKWKWSVVDRANRVQENEEFLVLMTKMNANTDENVEKINGYLQRNYGPSSDSCSPGPVKSHQTSEAMSKVIRCLAFDAESSSFSLKNKIQFAVESLSAVNRELESMGH